VVDDPVLRAEEERSSSLEVPAAGGLGDPQVDEVAGREGLARSDDVLGRLPVGVPVDEDAIRQFVFGDLDEGVEESGFDDLVTVGDEGVGVTEGEEMVDDRLALLLFRAPVA
jgi:hypothetical protein